MTDFISFEAEVDTESVLSDNDEEIDDNANDFIISDENVTQDSRNFYRQFDNVENNLDEVLHEVHNEALKDLENFDEISNLDEDEVEMEVDDFPSFETQIAKFEKTLKPDTNNQICNVILKALSYKKKGEQNLEQKLIEQINQPEKFKFIIDQQYFFNMCYELTMILSQFGYFLRVYELKKKYRHLFMKKPDQQKIVKQLSSCLTEKFNGFTIIRSEYEKKIRRNFEPIDIIYKPTKDITIEPLCYFSTDITFAYSACYEKKDNRKKSSTQLQLTRSSKVQSCHYCNHFFVHNNVKFEKHLKHCSGKPGIIYNFSNQSLISYEDNFKSKGDIPFTIYFDFETTAPTENAFDPEQRKMFVASYVIIVAFHPHLELNRIIVNRSFAHDFNQLTSINYFTREQIGFTNQYLINMLKDYANQVLKKNNKSSMGEMFSVEAALLKKILLKWFNAKFKRRFTMLSPVEKMKYEMANKIDIKKTECVICKFPLKLDITKFDNPKMTYGDFVVRFEYKFIRNIFNEGELSGQTRNLERYYIFFREFIEVCIGLLAFLNGNQRNFINESTEKFIEDEFPDETVVEIKNFIQKTDIKNVITQSRGEIYKFNLKIYAFVYDTLIFLPKSDIDYDTITSDRFFIHVHRLIKGKVHLHHSHVTGQILGYAHDFCNTTVIEKTKAEIPFIAHNFLVSIFFIF